MSKTARAKFICSSVIENETGTSISMHAVYSDDPNHENKAFNDATPGGNFNLHIAPGKEAADLFESGKEYYLDISLAEPAQSQPAAESEAE